MTHGDGRVLRTVTGDVPLDSLNGVFLAHEHLATPDFGRRTGDPDLEFPDPVALPADLAMAAEEGLIGMAEVSTYDMGIDLSAVVDVAERFGWAIVKTVGWYRSPYCDADATAGDEAMTERLVRDITEGIDGTSHPAGAIGETICGATDGEKAVLRASVLAAAHTGAAVILHTNDEDHARDSVSRTDDLGLPRNRLALAHCRPDDDPGWLAEIARSGALLCFDQLGHPRRPTPEVAACALADLLDAGVAPAQIALSADHSRRSRHLAAGGSGYVAGVAAAVHKLRQLGVAEWAIEEMTGKSAMTFLAVPK